MKSKSTVRQKCLENRNIAFNKKGSDCLKKKDINFKKLPVPPSGKRIKNVEVVIKLENVK